MYILPPLHNQTNTTMILERVCQPNHRAIYPTFEYIQRLNFELSKLRHPRRTRKPLESSRWIKRVTCVLDQGNGASLEALGYPI